MNIQKQLNMAIETVDFPIKHGDFILLFVSSPGRVCFCKNCEQNAQDDHANIDAAISPQNLCSCWSLSSSIILIIFYPLVI